MTVTLGSETSTWCPPRFGTPRAPSRPTLGNEVADMATRLGTPLMPWQQHVADVALELDDTNQLVYSKVVLTVPRQSGKTTLVMAKTLWRLIRMSHRHGPQRSTYTAQRRQDARKKLELDFAPKLRQSRSFREVEHARQAPTRPTQWRLSLNNGAERIQVGPYCYWQIDAPDEGAGHGDTLDDATIDEAFAHQDDAVEGGFSPSMATRADPQIWVLSTAGNGKSFYLWRHVLEGRAACESGRHGRTAYFEWSAPEDADPGDPETWKACSPALGHTIDLRFIEGEWEKAKRAEARGDTEKGTKTFRRAYLNQWPDIPQLPEEALLERVLPTEQWTGCLDPASTAVEVEFALDVAPDSKTASIAAAGRREDGRIHIEVVDTRPGTGWIATAAERLVAINGGSLHIDPKGPAGALLEELQAKNVDVIEVSLAEHQQACGALLDDVLNDRVRHIGQPDLDDAISAAVRRDVGDAWLWSRKRSTADITPLVAVTLARWAVINAEERAPNLW